MEHIHIFLFKRKIQAQTKAQRSSTPCSFVQCLFCPATWPAYSGSIPELLPEQHSACFGRSGQIVFQAWCLFGHMAFCLGFQVFPHTKALHLSAPHPALAFLQDTVVFSLPQPCSGPAHQTRSSSGSAPAWAGDAEPQCHCIAGTRTV